MNCSNMFTIIHWFHPSGQKKGIQDLSQRDQDGSKINSAQQHSTYQSERKEKNEKKYKKKNELFHIKTSHSTYQQ